MYKLVPFVAGLATVGIASDASAASSYCSPSGDYCMAVKKRTKGVIIRLDTFAFRGKIRVCVTPPTGSAACQSFRLRPKPEGLYGFKARYIPTAGSGSYRVRFFKSGNRIGKTLTFRR
jgi:hypothetical protein